MTLKSSRAENWPVASVVATGGHFGASTGRRLPNPVYRAVIVIVGLIAFAKLISS